MVQLLLKLLGFAHALVNTFPSTLMTATPITHGRSHVRKNMKLGMQGWGAWKKKGLSRRRGEERGPWGEMIYRILCMCEAVKEYIFKVLGNFFKWEI